ncbi:unnamed protein product [Sphagnum compactum]
METIMVELSPEISLHALRTDTTLMFPMSEVAVEVFHENPAAFGKDMRKGRYKRIRVLDQDLLFKLAQLGIPQEAVNVVGATLLPPDSLLKILEDRRQLEFIPKLRTALLTVITKDASNLIARGQFKDALPVTMDAIVTAQAIYYPNAPLQLVPIYLLAVQVNLGLERPIQSEDLLGIGSWLLLQDSSDQPKDAIRAELSRLLGQLSLLKKRPEPSLKAFAEEAYYKSREYGIYDVRTSIAFYNLSKVFYQTGQKSHCIAFWDLVIDVWMNALKEVVLHIPVERTMAWGKPQHPGSKGVHLDSAPAIAKLHIGEVCEMLQEIYIRTVEVQGEGHLSVGEASFVLGLALMHAQKKTQALEYLQNANGIYSTVGNKVMKKLTSTAIKIVLEPQLKRPSTRSSVSPSNPAPPKL